VSKFTSNWRQDELMAQISGRVISGMDKACAFAANDAKRRMRRRTGLAQSQVAYEVRPIRNTIWGWIGVRKGDAFYWYFHEIGTTKMSAHPAIRPAVFENGAQIVRLIAKG
jgi:HK97 gp10 family phage protein